MTFVLMEWERFGTFDTFLSLQTLFVAVSLLVLDVTFCYIGGLFLWRLKRKLETD